MNARTNWWRALGCSIAFFLAACGGATPGPEASEPMLEQEHQSIRIGGGCTPTTCSGPGAYFHCCGQVCCADSMACCLVGGSLECISGSCPN
jgi:hypothetical protein